MLGKLEWRDWGIHRLADHGDYKLTVSPDSFRPGFAWKWKVWWGAKYKIGDGTRCTRAEAEQAAFECLVSYLAGEDNREEV